MATHKTPVTVSRTSPGPKLDKTEDRALEAKRQEVLGKLGLTDDRSLPASAKEMLQGVLEGNRGRLELVDAEDLARRLRDRSAEVFGDRFRPSFDRPERLPIAGNIEVTKERKDGRFQLQGSLRADDHPVNRLMKDLEINPSSFGPEVRAVLDKTRGADLGHPATWNGFVRELAIASVKDRPLASLGQEEKAKGVSLGEAPSTSLGMGLEKTAKSKDAKESRLEDSPELLMNSEKIRNPEQEERRKTAVFQLQGALADAGLSKEQLEQFGPILDKVLRQGQLRGTASEKAWAIVGNIAQVQHGKSVPKDQVKDSSETRSGSCLIAAAQLFELAESKFGTKLDASRTDGVARILEGFVSSKGNETKTAPKIKLGATGKTKEGTPKPGAARPTPAVQMAHEHVRRMGIDPENPNAKHAVKDVELAFAKVLGDGKKGEVEVVKDGLSWLERATGGAESNFKAHAENILASGQTNPELVAQMKHVVLGRVALCAAAGKEGYVEHLKQAAAQSMAMGGGAGIMPGGPGAFGNLGGIFDKYGVANPIARQAMGAAILYDPALSHEDRIMLLLMLITQHMDQDRLRKMDELADLDRREATAAKQNQSASAGGAGGPGGPGDKPTEGTEGVPSPAKDSPMPASGEPQKARDVVMFELDRIGKMRDQIFSALLEIIKKKDQSVRDVTQSMQR